MDLVAADGICDELGSLRECTNTVPRLQKGQVPSISRGAVVISGALDGWKATHAWSLQALGDRFGTSQVRVALGAKGKPETMSLKEFVRYTERGADDDVNPRYVFEPHLRPPITEEYDSTVSGLFPHDLFKLLGESTRPPYRWLCLGPRRSGSRPHVDPLATSAWNALLRGRKRWVLIPPSAVGTLLPLGDVQAGELVPVEWFSQRLPKLRAKSPDNVFECIQEAGEIMYVPAGFWHAVLNITDTVAITHNFVGPEEFDNSWNAVCSERPGLAREWLPLLASSAPELARRTGGRVENSGYAHPDLSSIGNARAPLAVDDASVSWLLERRLQGKRHLGPPPSHLPSWEDAAMAARAPSEKGGSAIAMCVRSYQKGEVVFASEALAAVYEDEAQGLVQGLAERFPRTQQAAALLASWGMGQSSSGAEVCKAFNMHSHSVWCFAGGSRIEGLAIFSFSGLLSHSQEPALVLTFAANGCIAVAARDLEKGEKLTACLATWRFDEMRHKKELREAGVSSERIPWPVALPPQEGSQTAAATKFLASAERVAWHEHPDEQAQLQMAERLRQWLAEFDTRAGQDSRLVTQPSILRSSPYLCLCGQRLALHLSMGLHRLDDAWDAASRVLELLDHLPLHETSELCVALAVLGGALSFQQDQPARARRLFAAGERLVAMLFGASIHGNCWQLWLRSFLPEPLLGAAIAAASAVLEQQARSENPPGLGSHVEGSNTHWQQGTNIEVWEVLHSAPQTSVSPYRLPGSRHLEELD
eukprot:TRINITY_DN78358_c0_g1_i1.p1 TRINITY_DN78358_c0_g1~~TRINITY_DN78358_c0_g1_i1.p1  ORF type:complete len:762 (-),score=108.49 TRINITY_DN78358_c0_g1_i1:36-2321(-)